MLNNTKSGKEKIGNIGKKMVSTIYPSVMPHRNVSDLSDQQDILQTPESMGNPETEILIKMLDFMKSSDGKDKKYKKWEEKQNKAYSKQKEKKFDKIIDAFNPKKLSTSNTGDSRKKSKGFGVLASVGVVGAGALMLSNSALASVKVPNYGEMFDKDVEEGDMNFSNLFDNRFMSIKKDIDMGLSKDPMEEHEQSLIEEMNSSMKQINSEGFLSNLFEKVGLSARGGIGKESDSLVSKMMDSLNIKSFDDNLDLNSFNQTLRKWEGIFGGNTSGVSYDSAQTGSSLGRISEKYESGGRGSETVGWDAVGGTSYGKYQIASKVGAMDDYLDFLSKINPEAAKKLREAGPSDTGKEGSFAQVWKSMAKSGELGDTEHQYIKSRVYGVALRGVKDPSAREMIESDEGLREMFWSTSVHHGPSGAADIINRVYTPGMSKEEFIKSVYSERGTKFGRHTPEIQQSVRNRFISEQSDVMSLVGKPPSAVSTATQNRTTPLGSPVTVDRPTVTTDGNYPLYTSAMKRFGKMKSVLGSIIHHTGGSNVEGAMSTLKDRGLSYHYLIDKDGRVIPLLPEGAVGFHTADSDKIAGLNNTNTIGISLVAPDDRSVTPEQIMSARMLNEKLSSQYGYPLKNVWGHGQISRHKDANEGVTVVNAIRNTSTLDNLAFSTPPITPTPSYTTQTGANGGSNILQQNNRAENTTVAVSTQNISNLPIIIQMQQGITR